jgi:hypothetical protein
LKLINLQDYPNHKDISHIESVVCDSAIVEDEGNPRVQEKVIKTGQMFESLDTVKFLFSRLRCTSPSTIICGQVKQRRMIHHEVLDFELWLGCVATLYEK